MTPAGMESPVVGVTEFTRRIKALLEGGIGYCMVRGEVSNLRLQTSGHAYFSLKDAGAQVSAVMFRGDLARAKLKLRDGMQVVAGGQVSVYEPRGQYQLIIREVTEDGVGRLQREFEALKRRLADEGLFDSEKKKPLPAVPQTVGFITSPTGAAVQDFCRILIRREWRGRVIVLPAKVQGEGAAEEMIRMLRAAEAFRDEAGRGFDLLVIGRGGGSLEDLWAFNEEPLVRAVASCGIPVISAVGHEIDFTLCDFAADQRAETPSAAAELISSGFVAARDRLELLAGRVARAPAERLGDLAERVSGLRRHLKLLSPTAQIESGHLRLDDLSNRLDAATAGALSRHRQRLQAVSALLERRSPEVRVQIASHQLLAMWKRLQAASPASVLNRGFVILRDEQGRPVQRKAAVGPGARLSAEFADGRIGVRAEDEQANG